VDAQTDSEKAAKFVVWAALLLCAFGVCLALAGCGAQEPTEVKIPPVKRRQAVKTPSLDELFAKSDDDVYAYDPSGRRDPFKPLITPRKPTAPVDEVKMSCPPLQDFELASLKLVAIVWGELGRKAMFKAPNGRGYAIAEDMLVGRSCARVQRIESHAVIIEESRRDDDGKVLKEEVIIRLREGEG
jgi:type IV pilus assembly protein PilP